MLSAISARAIPKSGEQLAFVNGLWPLLSTLKVAIDPDDIARAKGLFPKMPLEVFNLWIGADRRARDLPRCPKLFPGTLRSLRSLCRPHTGGVQKSGAPSPA